jgi:hypothetical protein
MIRITLLSLVAVLMSGCSRGQTNGRTENDLAHQVLGTWQLVQTNGGAVTSKEAGRLKFFSGNRWIIIQADPTSGEVIFIHGGTFAIEGDTLVQQVEFAKGNTMNLIGQSHRFHTSVSGESLVQAGIGNRWNETWQRVK